MAVAAPRRYTIIFIPVAMFDLFAMDGCGLAEKEDYGLVE